MKELVREEIMELSRREEALSIDEWNTLRMNSWERELIIPNLGFKPFVHLAESHRDHCQIPRKLFKPASTYEESILNVFFPEALRRVLLGKVDPQGRTK